MGSILLSALGRSIEVLGDLLDLESFSRRWLAPVWQRESVGPADKRYWIRQTGIGWVAIEETTTGEIVVTEGPPEVVGEILAREIERWWSASVPGKIVIHAGAVASRGRAILLPAKGGAGKTTLVRALLALGAEYLSDDHAVVDRQGWVWPYPSQLRVLVGGDVVCLPPAAIGARVAAGPVPIGLIALTHYLEESQWAPREMTRGEGAAALLAHTLAASARPGLAMSVSAAASWNSLSIRSPRGEVEAIAPRLLELLGREQRQGALGPA